MSLRFFKFLVLFCLVTAKQAFPVTFGDPCEESLLRSFPKYPAAKAWSEGLLKRGKSINWHSFAIDVAPTSFSANEISEVEEYFRILRLHIDPRIPSHFPDNSEDVIAAALSTWLQTRGIAHRIEFSPLLPVNRYLFVLSVPGEHKLNQQARQQGIPIVYSPHYTVERIAGHLDSPLVLRAKQKPQNFLSKGLCWLGDCLSPKKTLKLYVPLESLLAENIDNKILTHERVHLQSYFDYRDERPSPWTGVAFNHGSAWPEYSGPELALVDAALRAPLSERKLKGYEAELWLDETPAWASGLSPAMPFDEGLATLVIALRTHAIARTALTALAEGSPLSTRLRTFYREPEHSVWASLWVHGTDVDLEIVVPLPTAQGVGRAQLNQNTELLRKRLQELMQALRSQISSISSLVRKLDPQE